MEANQYKVIIGALILTVIVVLLVTVALPRYRESVANEAVIAIAQRQTQTGNIFIVLNNTIQTMPIATICGGVK